MQKVKVIRKVPINGSAAFEVRTMPDNKLQGSFLFCLNVPADDPYYEGINLVKAMDLAAKIEKGNEDKEQIIYQTPNE